jgi:hypothetical protein
MSEPDPLPRPVTARDLRFFRTPRLWEHWPFLTVVRRKPGGEVECGVLYDCWTVAGRPGYRATVFLTNIFLLPRTEPEFLALPKETFDTVEEMAAAGWRVD